MSVARSLQSDITQELERNFRHNAMVNMIEGICFRFGFSFLARQTILVLYLDHLTDSEILVGLLSTIGNAGWLLPQLFTSNLEQRLPPKKLMPVNMDLREVRHLPILRQA